MSLGHLSSPLHSFSTSSRLVWVHQMSKLSGSQEQQYVETNAWEFFKPMFALFLLTSIGLSKSPGQAHSQVVAKRLYLLMRESATPHCKGFSEERGRICSLFTIFNSDRVSFRDLLYINKYIIIIIIIHNSLWGLNFWVVNKSTILRFQSLLPLHSLA